VTTPLATDALATAPLATAPLATAPLATAPLATAPLATEALRRRTGSATPTMSFARLFGKRNAAAQAAVDSTAAAGVSATGLAEKPRNEPCEEATAIRAVSKLPHREAIHEERKVITACANFDAKCSSSNVRTDDVAHYAHASQALSTAGRIAANEKSAVKMSGQAHAMADYRESQQVGAGTAAADAQVCANINAKSSTDSAFAEAAHVREAVHAAALKEKEKLLAAYQQEVLRLRGQLRSACEKGRTDDQGDLYLGDAIGSISHLETEILGQKWRIRRRCC
jgi:hypothetical protein